MKKELIDDQPGASAKLADPHEKEYKELLDESLEIYRDALRNGKTGEAALELARKHMQQYTFTV